MAKLVSSSFNQDSACICCGWTNGFTVFNCDPALERFQRPLQQPYEKIEMLYRTNIFAMVNKKTLIIWDDFQVKNIIELEFTHNINCVRIQKDCILVVTQVKAYIYKLLDFSLIRTIDVNSTVDNVGCMSASGIVCIPGKQIGQLQILYDNTLTEFIAHENAVTHTVFNKDGKLLATASERGTIIRVWNSQTGVKLCEFRRGSQCAKIRSIAFSNNLLLVSSNTETLHIYNLDDMTEIKFKIPGDSLCSFSSNGKIVYVFTPQNTFLKYTLNGERIETHTLTPPE